MPDNSTAVPAADGPDRQAFAHWDLVNLLARKHFRAEHLVIESADFVLQRLQENDWERVRKHTGRGSVRAYLSRVIQRLLHDFARQKFGRKQQPLWLRAQPSFWLKVHRLLCLEALPVREVIEIVAADVPGGRDDAAVRDAIAVIRTKDRDCGQSVAEVSLADVPEPAAAASSGDEAAVHSAELVESIFRLLTDQEPAAGDGGDLAGMIDRLRSQLALTAEERLLLRMVFEDGMKVTAAGRMLGFSAHVVHGQLRRLLARIKTAIEKSGLTDTLRAALEEP